MSNNLTLTRKSFRYQKQIKIVAILINADGYAKVLIQREDENGKYLVERIIKNEDKLNTIKN